MKAGVAVDRAPAVPAERNAVERERTDLAGLTASLDVVVRRTGPTLSQTLASLDSHASKSADNTFSGANRFAGDGNVFRGDGAGLTNLGSGKIGDDGSASLTTTLASLSGYASKSADNTFTSANTLVRRCT